MGAFHVPQSLMRLIKSWNSIAPCDLLLAEPLTFPSKISRIFHESYQSKTAYVIKSKEVFEHLILTFLQIVGDNVQNKKTFTTIDFQSDTRKYFDKIFKLPFVIRVSQDQVSVEPYMEMKK